MAMTRHYLCPSEYRLESATDLPGAGGIAPARQFRRNVLDTFDRRLAASGLVLVEDRDGGVRELSLRTNDGERLASAPFEGRQAASHLAFQNPRLRRRLGSIIDVRALLPVASWTVESERLDVCNEDAKVLGSLTLEHNQLGASVAVVSLCTQAKRGYQREFKRRLASWRRAGRCTRLDTDSAAMIAERLAPLARAYNGSAAIELACDDPPSRALVLLLTVCRSLMASNERGILDDTDIEFLHDFRIAVRRARAALVGFKQVPGDRNALRAALARAGRVTGPLRDLDVWSSELATNRSADAELVRFIGERRGQAHAALVKYLKSRAYRDLHRDLEKCVERLDAIRPGSRPEALRDCTDALISRRYMKLSRALHRHRRRVPVSSLHELRKDAKKLRYLLDACRSLYARDKLRPVIASLKAFQSESGKICDRHARSEILRTWLEEEHDAATRASLETAALEYELPSTFNLRKRRYRELNNAMRAFASRKNARVYEALLGAASV